MRYYLEAFQRAFDFDGRSSRIAYWFFIGVNLFIAFQLQELDRILGLQIGRSSMGWIYAGYVVVMFVPALAAAVRRLHDTGRSGHLLWLALVPLIGGLILLVLLLQRSDDTNAYGEPREDPMDWGSTESTDNRIMIFIIWSSVTALVFIVLSRWLFAKWNMSHDSLQKIFEMRSWLGFWFLFGLLMAIRRGRTKAWALFLVIFWLLFAFVATRIGEIPMW